MKKDLGGVRSEDIAEISKKYKQWADASRRLAANPRLFTKNPDKYGELKLQADTLYGETLKDIDESKEMKKLLQATTEKLGDVRNFDLLDEGAYEKFKQNALFRPTKELIQTGTYSFNNYLSPLIDSKEFIKKTANDIDSQAIIKNYEIPDATYTDKFGRTKKDKVDNVPLDSSMYSIVSKNLTDMKRGNVFAKQRLDEMIATKEDVAIRDAYDKFYKSDKAKEFKEFYDPSKKLVYDESASVKDRYAKLYAMSEFLNRVGVATREQGMPKLGDVERIFLSASLRKKAEKDGKEIPQTYDLSESFKIISKGGVTGVEESASLSNDYNSIGFADTMLPFTSSRYFVDVEPRKEFSDSFKIASEYPAFSKILSKGQGTKEKINSVAEEMANAMNVENRKLGFTNTDITADAVRSGKIMLLFSKDQSGADKIISLNTSGKSSTDFINKRVRLAQMSPSETRDFLKSSIRSVGGKITEAKRLGL